jgi:hypothetical protein
MGEELKNRREYNIRSFLIRNSVKDQLEEVDSVLGKWWNVSNHRIINLHINTSPEVEDKQFITSCYDFIIKSKESIYRMFTMEGIQLFEKYQSSVIVE